MRELRRLDVIQIVRIIDREARDSAKFQGPDNLLFRKPFRRSSPLWEEGRTGGLSVPSKNSLAILASADKRETERAAIQRSCAGL